MVEANPPPLAPVTTLTPAEKVVEMITPTPPPSPTLAAAPQPAGSWKRFSLTGQGVSFEAPADWEPLGDPAWSPDGGQTIFGARWGPSQPGMEVDTSLLPPNIIMQDKMNLTIGGKRAFRFLVKVYAADQPAPQADAEAPVRGYEADYILRGPDGNNVFNFYFFVPPAGDLTALNPVIQRVLDSIVWKG